MTPCGADTKYSKGGAKIMCKTCGAGCFTSGGGSSGGMNHTSCDECTAGYTCTGTSHKQLCPCGKFSSAGSTTCTVNCPGGKYGKIVGSTSAICASCPRGSRCADGYKFSCAAGSYQDATGKETCKPCRAKRFGSSSNMTNAQCSGTCPAGYFCPSGTSAPIVCPDGTFCAEGVDVPMVKLPCFPGRFVANVSDPSPARCADCAAGRFADEENAVDCKVCAGESFQPDAGKSFCRPHANCAKGERVVSLPSAAADRNCVPCEPGRFGHAKNAPSCTACPRGKFQDRSSETFCEAKQPCVPGTFEINATDKSNERCVPCPEMQFSSSSNAERCERCPSGKFQDTEGQPFCEACNEGFTCAANDEGIVELLSCPEGMSCTATGTERCMNQISNPSTGKCISCEDKHFAHTGDNTCVQCPLRSADGDSAVAKGVGCAGGAIAIDPDFFVVGSLGGFVPLGSKMQVVKCRGTGVCTTTASPADNFTVQTSCIEPAAGALCGSCATGYAPSSSGCVACAGSGPGTMAMLASALLLFGLLFRQCIKFALRNARQGRKSKFMTFSLLKIAMAFLFQTSLLSRFQLDWSGVSNLSCCCCCCCCCCAIVCF